MTTSKEPLRYKFEINWNIVEQAVSFRSLGIDLSNYWNVKNGVLQQVNKANRVAGCLGDTIWRNKHLSLKIKSRIYKSTIWPIITYYSETRQDKKIAEDCRDDKLQRITGRPLLDRERSEKIRMLCEVQNIGGWTHKRKKEWNAHMQWVAIGS